MKLELSKEETSKVFDVYGHALKDAAEGRAQLQRTQEKLSETDTARRNAIRGKEDAEYSLSQAQKDRDYYKKLHQEVSAQYQTLGVDIRNVRQELADAKKTIGTVSLQSALPYPWGAGSPQDYFVKVLTPLLDAMVHGNKIDAIKQVRELTALGLKEAKDMVEGSILQVPSKARSGCG